jgi:hypothetical protein
MLHLAFEVQKIDSPSAQSSLLFVRDKIKIGPKSVIKENTVRLFILILYKEPLYKGFDLLKSILIGRKIFLVALSNSFRLYR